MWATFVPILVFLGLSVLDLGRMYGATENAGVENAIRTKLQGWKMQEWKKGEQIAGVDKAGVSRMERQPEIILR